MIACGGTEAIAQTLRVARQKTQILGDDRIGPGVANRLENRHEGPSIHPIRGCRRAHREGKLPEAMESRKDRCARSVEQIGKIKA